MIEITALSLIKVLPTPFSLCVLGRVVDHRLSSAERKQRLLDCYLMAAAVANLIT